MGGRQLIIGGRQKAVDGVHMDIGQLSQLVSRRWWMAVACMGGEQ